MPTPYAGRFVVIDGPEGAGKSTQVTRLASALEKAGWEVVVTREPGGTPTGEALRSVLLQNRHREMYPLTELFVVCAARAQHVLEVIRPALEQGRIVVCDRFTPSTVVYQGIAGGVPLSVVERVEALARDGLLPDLTLILDVAPEVGPWRGLELQPTLFDQADRMESKDLEFHRRVREGYLQYAESAQEPCVVIDAHASPEVVAAEVLGHVRACLAGKRRAG
ncbi:MAG: dTMP kinase [Candidatus Zipacnadales bacterium]